MTPDEIADVMEANGEPAMRYWMFATGYDPLTLPEHPTRADVLAWATTLDSAGRIGQATCQCRMTGLILAMVS